MTTDRTVPNFFVESFAGAPNLSLVVCQELTEIKKSKEFERNYPKCLCAHTKDIIFALEKIKG